MDEEDKRELITFFDNGQYRIVKTTKVHECTIMYSVEHVTGKDAMGVDCWGNVLSFCRDAGGQLQRWSMPSSSTATEHVAMHVIDLLEHTLHVLDTHKLELAKTSKELKIREGRRRK
jgi:hypothetical protein